MHDIRKWMCLFEALDVEEDLDVWHASPHKFDKFQNNAASGEGGNSFGWGLYFTDSKAVADWYKAQFIRRFGKNHTYRAKIPEDDYLLWNTPLVGQSAKVQKIAKAAYNLVNGRYVIHPPKEENRGSQGIKVWHPWQVFRGKMMWRSGSEESEEAAIIKAKSLFPPKSDYMKMDGEEFYRKLADAFANKDDYQTGSYQRHASYYLRDKGLIGIKYLDGHGMAYNYVIFDANNISMVDVS